MSCVRSETLGRVKAIKNDLRDLAQQRLLGRGERVEHERTHVGDVPWCGRDDLAASSTGEFDIRRTRVLRRREAPNESSLFEA